MRSSDLCRTVPIISTFPSPAPSLSPTPQTDYFDQFKQDFHASMLRCCSDYKIVRILQQFIQYARCSMLLGHTRNLNTVLEAYTSPLPNPQTLYNNGLL